MTSSAYDPRSLDDLALLKQRAVQLFETKKSEEALGCFEQIALASPRDAEIQNYRARVFESLDRHEDALRCLDLALDIDPLNAANVRNRAI